MALDQGHRRRQLAAVRKEIDQEYGATTLKGCDPDENIQQSSDLTPRTNVSGLISK